MVAPNTLAQVATRSVTTILVVDDNMALRQAAEAMLATDGRTCIGVADSIAALSALGEHQPQVVELSLGDKVPTCPRCAVLRNQSLATGKVPPGARQP